MGTLTVADLKTEVKSFHGNRTDLDSRLVRFLNFAQIRIARAYSWPEFEKQATATGSFVNDLTDRFITLPSNIRSVRSFVLEDTSQSHKLAYKTPREFDRLYSGTRHSSKRRPVYYTRWQEIAEVSPVPDQAYDYEIRYVVWPTDLVNDGDTSDLDRKDELLILLAASIMHHSLGNTTKGRDLFGMFARLIEEAARDESVEPDSEIMAAVNDQGRIEEYWTNPFINGMPR